MPPSQPPRGSPVSYKPQTTYTRHNKIGPRTERVQFYATAAERRDMDAMRRRFGAVPVSRSLLVRTAIAALKRIMDTGYVPPVTDKLMLVERDAELPTQLALAIDFAKLACHADAAA
jgi:hypothetical protein